MKKIVAIAITLIGIILLGYVINIIFNGTSKQPTTQNQVVQGNALNSATPNTNIVSPIKEEPKKEEPKVEEPKKEEPKKEEPKPQQNGIDYSNIETRMIDVESSDAYKIIVNKKHSLDEFYNPGENAVAKNALLKLIKTMQDRGMPISNQYSGFRSYETQKALYQRYVNNDGQANADRYSARPGHSEHQSGLAFDLIESNTGGLLGESGLNQNEVKWLANNAHQFGFVLRYPQGKESITGYMYESWHIRFVGNDATKIYQSGLTLEEYYNVEGGNYR